MVNGLPGPDCESCAPDVLRLVHRNLRFLSGAHGHVPLDASREYQLCVPFSGNAVRIRLATPDHAEISIEPKAAFILSPRWEARIEWTGSASVVIVGFSAKTIAEAAGHLEVPNIVLRTGSTSDPLLCNIASMVRDAFASEHEFPPHLATSATSLLAIRLLTLADRTPSDSRREQLSPTALKRVLGFVESNLMEDFDLDEMARAAGCSRFHFARAFRSCTGVSPWKYVTRCRLRQAEALLRTQRRLSIAEICHMVGFQDQSHFTRAFKSVFSVTPGHLRRQLAA